MTKVWHREGVPLDEHNDASKESIGGWLMFFCVTRVIFAPLGTFKAIHDSPLLFWIVTYIVLLICSLASGIAVWTRSNSAFTFVRLDLLMTLGYAFMQVFWAARMLSLHYSSEMVTSEFERALGSALNVIIWFRYFKSSTRVRRTFGSNI